MEAEDVTLREPTLEDAFLGYYAHGEARAS